MRAVIALIAVLPAAAIAQSARATDVILDRAAMMAQVIGQTHEFFDGGRSFFAPSGDYSYTYPSGAIAQGSWSWPADNADGVICTAFRHGFERCDLYVLDNGRLVLVTSDGTRFPLRSNSADG